MRCIRRTLWGVLFLPLWVFVLSGCVGEDVNVRTLPKASPQGQVLIEIVPATLGPLLPEGVTGRLAFGTVADATVEIYALSELDQGPAFTTTTSNAENFELAGHFTIPEDTLYGREVYILTAHGGTILDANADGIRDEDPVANTVRLHSIFIGEHVQAGALHVSLLSEILFQRLSVVLRSGYSANVIEEEMRVRAAVLFKEDITNDGTLDNLDVLAWDPHLNMNALRHVETRYEALRQNLRDDENITAAALALTGTTLSTFNLPSGIHDLALAENHAYVAAGSDGLVIMDISNPTQPTQVGAIRLSNPSGTATLPTFPPLTVNAPYRDAKRVEVSGDLAAVADSLPDETYSIRFIDVANPAEPVILNSVPVSASSAPFELTADAVFVATDYDTVDVFNRANGLQTTADSSISVNGFISDIEVSKNLMAVSTWTANVVLYEITDTVQPVVVGQIPLKTIKLAAYKDYLYLYDGIGGLNIVDIADPAEPEVLKNMTIAESVEQLYIANSTLYINSLDHGIYTYDLSDPSSPRLTQPAPFLASARTVEVSGDIVASTESNAGVRLSVLSGGNSAVLTSVSLNGTPTSVLANEDKAYIAHQTGFTVVDLSAPLKPTVLAEEETKWATQDVAVEGQLLAASAFAAALEVYEIREPSQLARRSSLEVGIPRLPGSIALNDKRIYLTDAMSGLRIFDVADTSQPILTGSLSLPDPKGMVILNTTAYIADNRNGLIVVDVADPTRPNLLSTYASTRTAIAIAVEHGVAFLLTQDGAATDHPLQLEIVDISNVMDPAPLASLSLPSQTMVDVFLTKRLARVDNILYIASGRNGLHVIDVTAPDSPVLVGHLDGNVTPTSVAHARGMLYVADSDGRLKVVRAITDSLRL